MQVKNGWASSKKPKNLQDTQVKDGKTNFNQPKIVQNGRDLKPDSISPTLSIQSGFTFDVAGLNRRLELKDLSSFWVPQSPENSTKSPRLCTHFANTEYPIRFLPLT
jgi:hypothetical protein